MSFVMSKPAPREEFERTVWPTGAYDFSFKELEFGVYTPRNSKFGNDPYPGARFIFEDEEGDRFEAQVMKIPQHFQYNERAWFWKYVGALAGRSITVDDAIAIDPGGDWKEWNSWEEDLPPFFTKDVDVLKVKSIKVGGAEVLERGRVVSLSLELVEYEKNGEKREVNNVSSVLPKSTGGKKKKGTASVDLPE